MPCAHRAATSYKRKRINLTCKWIWIIAKFLYLKSKSNKWMDSIEVAGIGTEMIRQGWWNELEGICRSWNCLCWCFVVLVVFASGRELPPGSNQLTRICLASGRQTTTTTSTTHNLQFSIFALLGFTIGSCSTITTVCVWFISKELRTLSSIQPKLFNVKLPLARKQAVKEVSYVWKNR